MTYGEALAFLAQRRALGMRLGLERMHEALRLCGDVHKRLRVVHVAGTNGKGSTAQMIAAAASANGYRVGVFSSPYLADVREMLTLDGIMIAEQEFADTMARVASLSVELTEYECLTLAALLWFYEQRADLCVVECCMGGLTDATNVFEQPLATVFTPIALDHTAFLGETVEEIAAQKCGIMRTGCDVVVSPEQSPEALGVIMEHAARLGCRVIVPCLGASPPAISRDGTVAFLYGDRICRLPLLGDFQRANALTALETLEAIRCKGFPFDREMLLYGLNRLAMPCRQELISEEPLVMLDAAHNPHGIAALCKTVGSVFAGQKPVAVLGMLRDKDVDACVQMLAPLCELVVCCTPDNPRALSADELAEKVAAAGAAAVVCADPKSAVQLALSKAEACLICGSFYLCGPLRPYLLEILQK